MLKLKIKHMWIINCYIPQKRFDLITYPCNLITYPCNLITYPCNLITYPCNLITYPCNLITYPCNLRFMSVKKSSWCPTMSSEVIELTIASFISIHLLLDCLFVTVVCSSCHQRKPQSFASLALCEGNPPVVGGSPSQKTTSAESISMSWYCHDIQYIPRNIADFWENIHIVLFNKPIIPVWMRCSGLEYYTTAIEPE